MPRKQQPTSPSLPPDDPLTRKMPKTPFKWATTVETQPLDPDHPMGDIIPLQPLEPLNDPPPIPPSTPPGRWRIPPQQTEQVVPAQTHNQEISHQLMTLDQTVPVEAAAPSANLRSESSPQPAFAPLPAQVSPNPIPPTSLSASPSAAAPSPSALDETLAVFKNLTPETVATFTTRLCGVIGLTLSLLPLSFQNRLYRSAWEIVQQAAADGTALAACETLHSFSRGAWSLRKTEGILIALLCAEGIFIACSSEGCFSSPGD